MVNKKKVVTPFGGWSIEKGLFDYMLKNIPKGVNIVEFGSGSATKELMKQWNVWSIEQDKVWADKCPSNIIYAPIHNNWYDRKCIEGKLPQSMYAILVDGPTANTVGRKGMLDNLDLFDLGAMYIFDDVNRPKDHEVMVLFSQIVNREYEVFQSGEKKFGIIKKQ